jgi:modulator of FtsH protease
LANGHRVVLMAMGGTAAIFLGLSACVLGTQRDFGFLGGFRLAGNLFVSIFNLFTSLLYLIGFGSQSD